MEEDPLKEKIKLIKKPKIYKPINLKDIDIQNDFKKYDLFTRKKNKTIGKPIKRYKKSDIRQQILSMTYSINNYTQKSKKNLSLINELKSFNDLLLSSLNDNLHKNKYFGRKTEEIFHNLVFQYQNKGYKIPNLSKTDNNLFKKNPLLIENKKDVDFYYQEDPSTKGELIKDIKSFKEKNWVYLNKVNKACHKAKTYYVSKTSNSNENRDKNKKKFKKFFFSKIKNNKLEKKNIIKILYYINKIKKLIEKEKNKNKGKIILSYESKNKDNLRKNSESIRSKSIFNNALYNNAYKDINLLKTEKKLTTKNLNLLNLSNRKLSFISNNNKNNNIIHKRKKSRFRLITEIKNNKNLSQMFYHLNKIINTEKKIRIPGSEKLHKDIKSYLIKYRGKFDNQVLEESNADLLKIMGETRKNIRKKDIFSINKKHFSFSKEQENRIKFLEQIDKKVSNLDKLFIEKSVIKSFDDS